MTKQTQAPLPSELIADAAKSGVALYALMATLPEFDAAGTPPEWIDIFPQLGQITCRDGRSFMVEPSILIDTFAADAIELPMDINHATEWGIGESGRAVAWIKELRADATRMQARMDWLEEGISLLKAKKFKYISPAFYCDELGRAVRLTSVALVNVPALARQPALASAGKPPIPESNMKSFAKALGLADSATEAECLSALNDRAANSVSKKIHDETLAQLSTTSTELAALKKASRDEKVNGMIKAALAAKKIVPAEKDHYIALCASDEGLASVEKLLEAKTALLSGSGLDERPQPGADTVSDNPVELAKLAAQLQDEEAKAGRIISLAQAMTRVTEKRG